ncbi:hypothetical protein AB1L88_19985 [Tautonia sp. JC769]|uniref:hypothetical protein n=1 Tax=Tautonia sp. JC769 TaxID=3232135 RepID=UPI003459E55E
MTFPSRAVSLSLLLAVAFSQAAAAQDEPDDPRAPLPEGHFRIASFEFAETANIMAIEAEIEAPVGSIVDIRSEGPGPGGSRSRSSISSPSGKPTGRLHMLALLDRFGVYQSPIARDVEGLSTFMLFTKAARSGGGGGGSVVIPTDQPLDEILTPVMKPGLHRLGSSADAFRFQGKTYTITVTNPGAVVGENRR